MRKREREREKNEEWCTTIFNETDLWKSNDIIWFCCIYFENQVLVVFSQVFIVFLIGNNCVSAMRRKKNAFRKSLLNEYSCNNLIICYCCYVCVFVCVCFCFCFCSCSPSSLWVWLWHCFPHISTNVAIKLNIYTISVCNCWFWKWNVSLSPFLLFASMFMIYAKEKDDLFMKVGFHTHYNYSYYTLSIYQVWA